MRVNALAPDYVSTQKVIEYRNSFADPDAARAARMKLRPGSRIALPEEIAIASVIMITDECPFMNTTCLSLDDGLSVQHHPV